VRQSGGVSSTSVGRGSEVLWSISGQAIAWMHEGAIVIAVVGLSLPPGLAWCAESLPAPPVLPAAAYHGAIVACGSHLNVRDACHWLAGVHRLRPDVPLALVCEATHDAIVVLGTSGFALESVHTPSEMRDRGLLREAILRLHFRSSCGRIVRAWTSAVGLAIPDERAMLRAIVGHALRGGSVPAAPVAPQPLSAFSASDPVITRTRLARLSSNAISAKPRRSTYAG
jgi:hypothetical protein